MTPDGKIDQLRTDYRDAVRQLRELKPMPVVAIADLMAWSTDKAQLEMRKARRLALVHICGKDERGRFILAAAQTMDWQP